MGKRGPRPDKGDSRKRVGDIEIYKGSTKDGSSVVQWDAVIQCESEDCTIFNVCPYEKCGRCRVRSEYLDYVHNILHGQIDNENKMALFRLGLEIIPLFNQLIDIKIAAYGARVSYADKFGIKVNPILRELRACIKAISDSISSVTNMGAFESNGPKGVDAVIGDQDYYDNLFKGTPKKEEFKMRNRV